MKHIIILGDGMADWPAESLGNKTLLQYSSTPYMDKLAAMGRTGRLVTVAPGSGWSCNRAIWLCVVTLSASKMRR